MVIYMKKLTEKVYGHIVTISMIILVKYFVYVVLT